jgi:peptidoglycan/xylan/chitin deacetylase (PgdA/CDA1 family)
MIKFKASFDDGCQLDLRLATLLMEYDITDVVFYIPSDWHYVNRLQGHVPLSPSDLRDLADVFTIGSHTIHHEMLTRIPYEQMIEEVEQSKVQLEDLLGRPIDNFCYPRGYANDDIRDVVRRTYKSARNTLVGSLTPAEDPVWEYTTLHISGRRRKEYEETSWQEEANRLLETAQARDAAGEETVFHFWGHSWEIERYYDWGEFEKFLQKVKGIQDEAIHSAA